MAAKRRSAKKRSSGPGAPAVLGVMTVLVLLIGGWILAGGYADGFVSSLSDRVSEVGGYSRTPTPTPPAQIAAPTPVPTTSVAPQPTAAVVDNTRVKELETELAKAKTALGKKDEEVAGLRAEVDNLKASMALLKAELNMRSVKKGNE